MSESILNAARHPTTQRDLFGVDGLGQTLKLNEPDFDLSLGELGGKAHDGELSGHDFPVYIPLAHDNPHLTSETFNVDQFLLSRSYTSLPDLRAELRDYLGALKEELVTLINDDYEAFITLSTDLRGEGARLERVKYPLDSLRGQMLVSRGELQTVQDTIRDKLKQRYVLREETALLRLLLKISESVTRLESLLLIISPHDESLASPRPRANRILDTGTEDDNVDDGMRGNRAKHLGRVAAEYSQLLYHISKARSEKCAFVRELQWRVDRIQSTLTSDLNHLFSSVLRDLTDEKKDNKATEFEKAKRINDLTECLRTYDILCLWRDAEEVVKAEVMRAFIKKTVFSGALAVPHSPIVPHTPFPGRTQGTAPRPPRTPYTPFSAFVPKQSTSLLSAGSPYSLLLDAADDPLARLYSQILRFVERDMSLIMEIAEKVTAKSITHVRSSSGSGAVNTALPNVVKTGEEGFEIMANVIWAELGKAIMDELGSVVFTVGRPDEFRKHHWITTTFIRSLEFLAPSVRSIEALRSHPVFVAFDRRWQLSVYFQMRWKEIVIKAEDILSTPRVDILSTKDDNVFATAQAAAVWEAIATCWSEDVFIPELGHRLWKLTLQLLNRFRIWLNSDFDHVSKVALEDTGKLQSAGSSGPISPAPPTEAMSAEINAAHDKVLLQCVAAIVDITSMQPQVLGLWRENISMMLPESTADDAEDIDLEAVLQSTLSKLTSLAPFLSNQIVTILSRRACDALLPVRSIPSQFRAMSNKRSPTEPSYFVSTILRSVKIFFGIIGEGPGSHLKERFLQSYASEVFHNASQRYAYYLTVMKKTEESLRRLKKGRQTAFSLFSGAGSGNDEDEERIRTQMILDVQEFARDAETMGVIPTASPAFKVLHGMVHATWLDVSDI